MVMAVARPGECAAVEMMLLELGLLVAPSALEDNVLSVGAGLVEEDVLLSLIDEVEDELDDELDDELEEEAREVELDDVDVKLGWKVFTGPASESELDLG